MKLADSLKLSLNSVSHRKLRSWLTLLGIVIGVAAIVSIVSIGEGAQQSVNNSLSRFGADIITITPGFGRAGFFGGELRGGGGPPAQSATTAIPTLGPLDDVMVKGNPNVLYVNETVSGRATVIFVAETTTASVQGINPATWAQVANPQLASGRLLGTSDTASVVIGDSIANSVFREPITPGREIAIGGRAFTVIGILAAGNSDSAIFMPYNQAWNVLTDVNRNNYTSLQVKVKDASLVDQTTTDLTNSLRNERKVTARNQDFSVTSSEAIRQQVNSTLGALTLFLGAIAAISLVVGAIGVANSMFTSVLEKTREVGIMKALGATNNEIMLLFIIESALFGLIGGAMGAALGWLVSGTLSAAGGIGNGITTLVTPQLIILAIALSTIVGITAGYIPARMAANLSPVEALRYE